MFRASLAILMLVAQSAAVGKPAPQPARLRGTVSASIADISVTKTIEPGQINDGFGLTYRIVIANAGPEAASNVVFTDALPDHLYFMGIMEVPIGWTAVTPPSYAPGTVTVSVPSLPSGASVTFRVGTAVLDSATGSVTNTATVRTSSVDPRPADNTSSATSPILPRGLPALHATKAVSGTLLPGSIVSYTIVLSNRGTALQPDNPGFEFADLLPSGLQLVSAYSPMGPSVWTPERTRSRGTGRSPRARARGSKSPRLSWKDRRRGLRFRTRASRPWISTVTASTKRRA
jgi:uncharacterized repeat protein (TIGR01451 family)